MQRQYFVPERSRIVGPRGPRGPPGPAGVGSTFDISADSGTTQPVDSGDTLIVSGGSGIDSAIADNGGNPELTLALTDLGTEGSYTAANITVDAQGRITAAASGGAAFDISADSGTTQPVDSGDTLIVSGGSGIDSAIADNGGNPELTLALTDLGTQGSYSAANITVDAQGRITAATSGAVDEVLIPCKNETANTLAKGTPVYITGTVGASDVLTVDAADATSSSSMPVSGLLTTSLAPNGEGFVIQSGILKAVDTVNITGSPSVNGTLYVDAGGGLTTVKPTGTNLIQNVGKVARLDAVNGSILVSAILRSNDIPNIPQGQAWIGDASGVATPTTVSFDAAGDSGTVTISNSDTLTIAGGTGLTSTAAATDTVTLDLDNTTVTAGSYTNANITVDAQGRLTVASSGSSGMTSWDAAGDLGTAQTIGDGETLTVSGGSGLGLTMASTSAAAAQITSTTTNKATYESNSITRDAYTNVQNYAAQVLFAASVPGYCHVEFTLPAGTASLFFAGLIQSTESPLASDTPQFPDMYSINYAAGNLRVVYGGAFNGTGQSVSSTDVLSVTYDGSAGTITFKKNGTSLGFQKTGLANNLVFHAKFEKYIRNTDTTTALVFDDILVLSSSSTSKRVTIVPNSGTLVQEHGGTGLDFTAATDGQILIGATGAAAALGVVDGGNNITVTYASGDISISANATSITSTSGYYEVWYDATNGLFKYYTPPAV